MWPVLLARVVASAPGLCGGLCFWLVCGLCSWSVLLACVAACALVPWCQPVLLAHVPACITGLCGGWCYWRMAHVAACVTGPCGILCYWPVWRPLLLARVAAFVTSPCGSLCCWCVLWPDVAVLCGGLCCRFVWGLCLLACVGGGGVIPGLCRGRCCPVLLVYGC